MYSAVFHAHNCSGNVTLRYYDLRLHYRYKMVPGDNYRGDFSYVELVVWNKGKGIYNEANESVTKTLERYIKGFLMNKHP